MAHKCEEVDIQIGTKGWRSAKDAIHELIPVLYNLKLDLRNFPNLSNYLKQAVGVLPKEEFVINRLDLLFKNHPHLQPIQESIYKAVKTFLSAIKHPDCMQFRNVDFADRVSDADRVADPYAAICNEKDNQDCVHDKTHDINVSYLTTDSEFLEDRLRQEYKVYRTLSCPDLKKGLKYNPQKDSEDNIHTPPYSDDEDSITKIKEKFRASTPKRGKEVDKKLPHPVNLQDILHDPAGLQIPPQDIIAAPAGQGDIQRGQNRVNQMAQNAGLRGADPALVQILTRIQDRDEQKDNSRKKLLMLPKTVFNGTNKDLAKSHWLEFQKYVDYQRQHNLLHPDNRADFPEVKQMFRLTLSDYALGWYDAEETNWTRMEHMKQAFLKRFNIWGDTRHQQQDAWNKLQFDMAKDDVDSFVTDMKTLASILGHNQDVITEKFKDIFPNKNIEAALIEMDNLDDMQAKAKQLVPIYRPSSGTDASALGACLMHTQEPKVSTKGKKEQTKVSNQHQLAPRPNNSSQEYPANTHTQAQGQRQGNQKGYNKDNGSYQDTRGYYRENTFRDARGRGRGRGGRGRGGKPPWKNNDNNQGHNSQKGNESQQGRGGGGQNNKGRGRGYENQQSQYNNSYNPTNQGQYPYMAPPPTPPQGLLPAPPPYDPNWQLRQTQFYNSPAVGGYALQGQYSHNQPPPQYTGDCQSYRSSKQAKNVCKLCGNPGHYDYQCQFASDFLTRTQKAFQRSHYMHESQSDQEWSRG